MADRGNVMDGIDVIHIELEDGRTVHIDSRRLLAQVRAPARPAQPATQPAAPVTRARARARARPRARAQEPERPRKRKREPFTELYSAETCAVCLEQFADADRRAVYACGKHVFHVACVRSATRAARREGMTIKCPTCGFEP